MFGIIQIQADCSYEEQSIKMAGVISQSYNKDMRTNLVHEATNLLPDGIESINYSLKSIIPNVWLICKIKLFGLISSI